MFGSSLGPSAKKTNRPISVFICRLIQLLLRRDQNVHRRLLLSRLRLYAVLKKASRAMFLRRSYVYVCVCVCVWPMFCIECGNWRMRLTTDWTHKNNPHSRIYQARHCFRVHTIRAGTHFHSIHSKQPRKVSAVNMEKYRALLCASVGCFWDHKWREFFSRADSSL